MAGESTLQVLVSREGSGWRAEVVELSVQRKARTLHALDRRIRDLVGSGWVDYDFHTGNAELDRLVAGVRMARRAVQVAEDRARSLTDRVIALAPGMSVRDLGVLLGLSHQRAHQLLQQANQPG
jgi:hypothetical protein